MQKAVILILLVLLAGCATGTKKQEHSPQPAMCERPQILYNDETYLLNDYDHDNDVKPLKGYEKTIQKKYVEPAVHLSLKQIQTALKKAGYYKGAIDGKAGPRTREAILKFQRDNGLKMDGIAGRKTSAALNKYLK